MLTLLRLAAQLAANQAQRVAGRMAGISALMAAAFVFAMFGLVGFGVALFIVLARVMDPALAAVIMGSFSFLIAAVLLLVARSRGTKAGLFASTPEERQARLDLLALSKADPTAVWLPLVLAVLAGYAVTSGKDKS